MELASRDDELENDTNQARWQQVLYDWAKRKQIWGRETQAQQYLRNRRASLLLLLLTPQRWSPNGTR